MIQNSAPNPSRIELARKRRGLTKTALARRAGIATRSLYDVESGQATPTPETLTALSQALRFPIEFFFRPDIDEPTPDAASFRALRSMSAARRNAALSAGALAFELGQWIDARFQLPTPALPDLRGYEPEAAAIAVRSLWNIGERAIGNMIHLLESQGVRVFSLAEDRRVDAFSLWHRAVPFIFLNTAKTAEHSRMDAAHELGHLVLHRHGAPWGRDVEKDAQAFGAAFLMPRASVFATPRLTVPTFGQLVQLKKLWLVSASALAHRLHELELLSDWNYRGLCIQLAQFGRTREPEGIPRETSQIMAKVFGSLGASGTSRADVAKDLGVFQADIEALVFGLRAEPATDTAPPRPPRTAPVRRQFRIV